MKKNFYINPDRIYFIYCILYLSLIIGFLFNENIAGGGEKDYYLLHIHLIKTGFKNGVIDYLFNFFPSGTLNHSPIYYIIIYYLQNLVGNEITRIILLHLYLLIPIYFYKILICQNNKSKYVYILIPLIFFVSPNLRSIAIWSGREILSLLFLIISIFYYLNFDRTKYLKCIYFSFIFLVMGSYISPEIGIISIIYLFKYYNHINLKEFSKLISFNLILSIPFIYYIIFFYSDNEFNNPLLFNLYKNIPVFFSSIFIVTIPFILFKNLNDYLKFIKNNLILIFVILIVSYLIFNSPYQDGFGGGVMFRMLSKLNLENLIFLIATIGFVNIMFLIKNKYKFNLFILLIFIIQCSLNLHFFQKYIDINFILYFLFLFKSKIIQNYFNNKKFVIFFLIFNFCYYFGSLLYRII